MGVSTIRAADPALLEWLGRHDVEYEIHEHPAAFTAESVARAEGVDPHMLAKVVAVATADGHRAFLVLEATDRLDLHKAANALETDSVRLLTEAELATLAPSCEVGAMPAVASLFGLDMLADSALREVRDISFNAGSHRLTVHVDRVDWERATGVRYGDLAADRLDRPAWDRA